MFAKPTTSILQRFAATLIAGSVLLSGQAMAADMLEDGSYEASTPVEYGTGWYLRGEIGVSFNGIKREGATSEPIVGTFDQEVETTDQNSVWGFGAAVGRRFGNLRGDLGVERVAKGSISSTAPVTGGFRPPCSDAFRIVTDGFGGQSYIPGHTITNCLTESASTYDISAASLNVAYDIPKSFGGFRPFVGASLGLFRNSFTSSTDDITCQASEFERCNPTDGGTTEDGGRYRQLGSRVNGTSYHLGGGVTGGISYAINDQLFFDTSYKYTKIIEDPLWNGIDGVEPAKVPTQFHTVKVGLRYEIW
ncbi:MAG: hypothetical protein AAFO70_00765 [Pseudomonadota bacterium]